ncbi:MAG: LamG domain-containing protein [Cryomorphaceae bacterium]|nr:LamG domain-containing protein [Cryomorphaceae bacterium]
MRKTLLFIGLSMFKLGLSQINEGMVAHFPFDNNLLDISSSSIMATNNGTTFGLDRNGTNNLAINSNGSSYVSFNDNSIKTALPVSISVWVKISAFDAVLSSPIFNSDSDYNNYWGYMLALTPTGKVYTQFGAGLGSAGSSNKRGFLTTNSIATGSWHHIVAIIKSSNDMQVYLDCQQWTGAYSGSGSIAIDYSTTSSRIGSEAANSTSVNGTYLNGSMDQLAIWGRELTSTEISFLCDSFNSLDLEEIDSTPKELVKIFDLMGRETEFKSNTPLILVYSDGTFERVLSVE